MAEEGIWDLILFRGSIFLGGYHLRKFLLSEMSIILSMSMGCIMHFLLCRVEVL